MKNYTGEYAAWHFENPDCSPLCRRPTGYTLLECAEGSNLLTFQTTKNVEYVTCKRCLKMLKIRGIVPSGQVKQETGGTTFYGMEVDEKYQAAIAELEKRGYNVDVMIRFARALGNMKRTNSVKVKRRKRKSTTIAKIKDKRKIFELRESGVPPREIALKFGISRKYIYKILYKGTAENE